MDERLIEILEVILHELVTDDALLDSTKHGLYRASDMLDHLKTDMEE